MSLFGLGFRPKYYHQIVSEESSIDFFEIISENFMGVGGRPSRFLAQLCERYPVTMHGVGLGIAGVSPLNIDYLDALRLLVRRVNPRFVSDHLCWTSYVRKNSHDLLPTRFTEDTLELVASRLRQIQDLLGRRFFIENPSAYVTFSENDFDEATFMAELVRRSGCGLLLDVNNLFLNAANLGYDAVGYLRTIPTDAVGYFHLAGHTENPDVRIDTHDMPVCSEVWTLYKLAARRFPSALTLLERDDNYPPLEDLEKELQHARNLREHALTCSIEALEEEVRQELLPPIPQERRFSRLGWESVSASMFTMVEQFSNVLWNDDRLKLFDASRPVPALRGINVYNNAYFFRLRDCIASEVPLLFRLLDRERFSEMIARYLESCPPGHYDIRWAGANLPIWLRECETVWLSSWGNKALADLAALELKRSLIYDAADGFPSLEATALSEVPVDAWEDLVFQFQPYAAVLVTDHDIWDAWIQTSDGVIPRTTPRAQPCYYLVYRQGEDVFHERMDAAESRLFQTLAHGLQFRKACVAYADDEEVDSTTLQAVLAHLLYWFEKGLIHKVGVV